jgi:hypothetical protein
MKRTQTILVCDGSHPQEEPATHKAKVTIDGKSINADLCQECTVGLRRLLNRSEIRNGKARSEELAAIRTWALGEGYDIALKGRVPNDVEEAYRQAMGRRRKRVSA